ncbi:hypothetical protein TNCV_1190561 [Trichonephila clavipes]|nr:hypothetical protein TNCV_1190561 [Trichonephila clavipes]
MSASDTLHHSFRAEALARCRSPPILFSFVRSTYSHRSVWILTRTIEVDWSPLLTVARKRSPSIKKIGCVFYTPQFISHVSPSIITALISGYSTFQCYLRSTDFKY